jgi:hypothetical protein
MSMRQQLYVTVTLLSDRYHLISRLDLTTEVLDLLCWFVPGCVLEQFVGDH